jgi:DNA-binding Lrp family transcriptional regulator
MDSGERTIDDLDRGIAERLRVDGRETNRSLAQALGVNEATIASRLKRLEAEDVIHVVALTDMRGFGKDFFAFALITVDDRRALDVARDVATVPEVIAVTLTTGRFDIVASVLVRDRETLGRIIGEALPSIPGVGTVRCELAVDVLRFDSEWAALRTRGDLAALPSPALETDGVDELDLAIVSALQRDARSSNRRIASELDVSEGTIRQRVRRMEEERLIRIRAVSDIEAFAFTASATVGVHVRGGAVEAVGRRLAAMENVAAVVRSVGEFDFVLITLARSRAELIETVLGRIQAMDGVRATETLETAAAVKHVYTWVRLVDPA